MKRLLAVLLIILSFASPVYARGKTQFDLTYLGRPTSMGCAPFAIAYLTSLVGQSMSAQDILDSNASQGQFTSLGMSPSSAHDELYQGGFLSLDFYGKIPSPPFLAAVVMHRGYHSIIITSLSSSVDFYDPWDGLVHKISLKTLYSIWPCRCGMAITRSARWIP